MPAGNASRVVSDVYTGGLVDIDPSHLAIHESRHYTASRVVDVAGAGTALYLIACLSTATVGVHFAMNLITELEAQIDIYEGTTVSANGTAVNIFNRNRKSGTNPTGSGMVSIFHTPTVTADGTLIYTSHAGTQTGPGNQGGGSGFNTRGDSELILKDSTLYLVRITNAHATNANQVAIDFEWYEQTRVF